MSDGQINAMMGALFGAVISGLVFAGTVHANVTDWWERQTVARGFAHYEIENGAWQWNDPMLSP